MPSPRAIAGSRSFERDFYHYVPAIALLGGSLNGFASRIIDAGLTSGLSLPAFGLSPFEVLALVVATILVSDPGITTARRPHAAEAIAILSLLVPSSTFAWLATAGYATYLATVSRDNRRAGAILMVGLALSALWSMAFAHWLVEFATRHEAWLTASLLGLFQDGVTQTRNVISTATGHTLVVLAACSAFEGLPRALVGMSAVALLAGAPDIGRLVRAAPAAACLYCLGSLARLVLIASSDAGYTIGHGEIGSSVYDLLQTGAMVSVGLLAARK